MLIDAYELPRTGIFKGSSEETMGCQGRGEDEMGETGTVDK